FVSHKLLRWLAPVFLVLALVSSIAAAVISPVWIWAAVPQLFFYLLGWAAWRFPVLHAPVFRIPYYFTMVNAAALVGLFKGWRRGQKATWARTERAARPPERVK